MSKMPLYYEGQKKNYVCTGYFFHHDLLIVRTNFLDPTLKIRPANGPSNYKFASRLVQLV